MKASSGSPGSHRIPFWRVRISGPPGSIPRTATACLRNSGTWEKRAAVNLEYRWRCADGVERHFLDQMVLMRDDDGSPHEFFGMWFDITERKQMEQNLLHASKLEAVGRLTGGIAHDFNNMLSVVIGNLDLLKKSIQGNEKAERRVHMALESAQHCADLTYRLLTFSRRQALQISTIDVTGLMPSLLELMRRTLGENIRASFQAGESVWPIQVDRAQLEAALLNLAVNARDAMPDGGDLTIAVENQVLEDGKIGSRRRVRRDIRERYRNRHAA